jgi:hypothetical protein
MAGIIGTSLLGLPTTASGKTKSKTQRTQTKKASKSSSRKSTSPSPDYKSKYKKKDPPPNGGRPPRQKNNPDPRIKDRRPPNIKIKHPPSGGQYKRRFPPPRRPVLPPGNDDPGHDHPIIYPPPVIIVDGYQVVYYEEPYYYEEEPNYNVESASLLFAGTSMVLNYAFIRDGQTNGIAAGVGIFFGITAMAVATHPNAKHPVLGYLLGGAAIVFSVWNLSGGMDSLDGYDSDDYYYDDGYYSYSAAPPAGRFPSDYFDQSMRTITAPSRSGRSL